MWIGWRVLKSLCPYFLSLLNVTRVGKVADEIISLDELTTDKANARVHKERALSMLVKSLETVGAARSGVIDEHGCILAGNLTAEALAELGIKRVRVVETDGNEWVVVRRTGLTGEQKALLSLYDNRVTELGDWDVDVLHILDSIAVPLDEVWNNEELLELLGEEFGGEEKAPAEDVKIELQAAFTWPLCVCITVATLVELLALRKALGIKELEDVQRGNFDFGELNLSG